jgi:hypothetical protein
VSVTANWVTGIVDSLLVGKGVHVAYCLVAMVSGGDGGSGGARAAVGMLLGGE